MGFERHCTYSDAVVAFSPTTLRKERDVQIFFLHISRNTWGRCSEHMGRYNFIVRDLGDLLRPDNYQHRSRTYLPS